MALDSRVTDAGSTARGKRLRARTSQDAARRKPMPWAERHRQLLSVAEEIIHKEGIGALTMSALAERSGASKPVVYDHFANREEVAIELMEEGYNKTTKYVADNLERSQNIFEYMDIVVESLFEVLSHSSFRVRKVTNGFSASSEVNKAYIIKQRENHQLIKNILLKQDVSESVSDVAAYVLMLMINEAVAQFVDNRSPVDKDTIQRMVRGAIHALLPENKIKPLKASEVLDTSTSPLKLRGSATSKGKNKGKQA
jgi:AcrR family transcriptional regulator